MRGNAIIRDYTQGNIPKQMFRFMLPFMGSNALQLVYSIVDMIIVGRFVGSDGLVGVSQGSMLVNFTSYLCMGFCTGGQIIISQLIGAGRRKELNSVIGTLLTSIIIISAIVTAITVGLRSPVVELLNVPLKSRDMAVDYILICGSGMVFICGYNMFSAIMRGMGDSRHPFIFIAIASVVNLLLDLLFTGYLGFGVAGAAFATVIGQIVSFAAALIFLYRRRASFEFDFKLRSFQIRGTIFWNNIRLGIPLALQACAINLSMMFLNSYINELGVAASATFGVGIKLDDISNKLSMGVQYAAAPMIGQNIGARNTKRVKSSVWWTWAFSALIAVLLVLCYVFFGREMFALFTDDIEVLDFSPVFISAALWTFPGMVIMRGANAFLQGTGSTTIIMCFSFIDAGLRVIMSYLIGVVCGLGFFGYVLGFALAPYGVAVPGALYFFFGKWKDKKLVADR